MIFKISTFFILTLLLSACTVKVMIDNPTEKDIIVSIDGNEHSLPAYDFKTIELKKALAEVITKDNDGIELMNQEVEISGEGVLNVTKSTYIIWNDLYCLSEDYDKYRDKLNLKELVIVNEKEYEEVDFTLVEDAFISRNWDYGLDQNFPDSVDLVNDYAIKSKIYSVQDLEDEFGYFGDLDFSDYQEEDINAFLDSLKQVLQIEEE